MNPTTEQKAALSAVGKAGGKASAAKLTPEQRKAKASKAARVMWARRRAIQGAANNLGET